MLADLSFLRMSPCHTDILNRHVSPGIRLESHGFLLMKRRIYGEAFAQCEEGLNQELKELLPVHHSFLRHDVPVSCFQGQSLKLAATRVESAHIEDKLHIQCTIMFASKIPQWLQGRYRNGCKAHSCTFTSTPSAI